VIFSSSGGAGYGECPGPVAEDFPFLPLSPYGIAKKCGEEYLAGWNRIHGSSNVSLRFANVFGPRQDSGLEGGVVAIFLERLARSEPTTIFGDGTQVRDFVYVGDIVGSLLAAAGASGGPYNVGTGVGTTVAELHRACAHVAGAPNEPRQEAARLGDVHRSVLDASLIEREFGWRPEVSLEEGLRRTWEWMRKE
jgi:UDP-glucose 4-epimerase